MSASVIIPTHCRSEMLAETLQALARQTEADFEAIVVCDGEDAPTKALSQSLTTPFPVTWIFAKESSGPAAARNAGALASGGDLLLFLDDDTPPTPDWLSCHRKHHSFPSRERDRVVIGRLYNRYPRPPSSHTERFLREDVETRLSELNALFRRMDRDAVAEFWVGLNTSLTRARFISSGGFDPALRHAVQEDSELAVRIRGQGVEFVYEPLAIVYHNSTKDLVEQRFLDAVHGGEADVHRVRDKGQGGAPILRAMMEGGLLQRLKHRMAWREPGITRRIAELCGGVADLAGSRFFYARWASLIFAVGYWQGVKSQGITLRSLHQLPPLLGR